MKKLLLSIISILMVGCAQEKAIQINTEFSVYMSQFKYIGKQFNQNINYENIIIKFDDSLNGSRILGVCRSGGFMPNQVTINTQWWKSSSVSNAAREQLVFHELGHCVLNREHKDDDVRASDDSRWMPVSIMNSYHFRHEYYTGNYSQYMSELFTGQAPSSLYAYGNDNSFPGSVYASTAQNTYSSSMGEVVEYKAIGKLNSDKEGPLSDEDYANLENFGCGSGDHSH